MAGTFACLLFHIVFSTKHRTPSITPELQPRLYDYMGGTLRGEKVVPLQIGGVADHVHFLVRSQQTINIPRLLRNLKSHSSGWVHREFPRMSDFGWQDGYGIFTVSISRENHVKKYIQNQEEHHRETDFKAEFLHFLHRHKIEHDERYVWD